MGSKKNQSRSIPSSDQVDDSLEAKEKPVTPYKKAHQNQAKQLPSRRVRSSKKKGAAWPWIIGGILLLLVIGRVGSMAYGAVRAYFAEAERVHHAEVVLDSNTPSLSLEEIQKQKRIINVHEHIQSLQHVPIYLDIMDELGFQKICLMGSSMFTITLNEKYGFTGYDENNEELLKIVKAHPGRFEAWVTINPLDKDKLEKFKDCVSRGATGLKLYLGHGYIAKTGEYMFHPVAMDDPGMLPLYAYCQENYIPVCLHVNPYKDKPGFAQELIAVLTQFPDMKVDVPHFVLSSIKSSRLREYLDTFPNLYTDVSFGDYYVKAGLARISKDPEKFRKIFEDYPDRIMFATDLVLTDGPSKNREWVRQQFQAYLDMLSKETYTSTIFPDKTMNGLALPDRLLNRILYQNYLDFVASRPKGTKITRSIDWSQMGQQPIQRQPGQAFPPPKDGKKGL